MNDKLMELRDYLLNVAECHSIEVEDIPNISGTHMYVRCFNKIFMNPNETTVTYEFGLAHELSHALYGDPSRERYYPSSPIFKIAEEKAANKNAVRLISDYIYRDTPVESRNWQRFVNVFKVPSYCECAW